MSISPEKYNIDKCGYVRVGNSKMRKKGQIQVCKGGPRVTLS